MMFPKRSSNKDGQLKIVKGSKEYVLPAAWALKDAGSYDFKAKLADNAFVHGSEVTGDKKAKGHTIQVEFNLSGATEEEHDEAMNMAYSYFTMTDYQLFCGRADRYYQVAGLSKIKHEYEKGFKQRMSKVTVSLLCAKPFRYSAVPTIIEKNFASEQKETEIIINNTSSVEVPLIWSFAPPDGKSTSDITIVHAESGQSFTLKDTLLTAPAVAVVNAESGTVRRDTGNSLNTFSGLFLFAEPGQNTYKYTGAACNIIIQYTGRWYI